MSDRVSVTLRADYWRRELWAIDASGAGAVFDRRDRSESFDTATSGTWRPSEERTFTLRLHHAQFRNQLLQDQRFGRLLDQ